MGTKFGQWQIRLESGTTALDISSIYYWPGAAILLSVLSAVVHAYAIIIVPLAFILQNVPFSLSGFAISRGMDQMGVIEALYL